VAVDGAPCWGNLLTSVAECRASGDMFHVIMLADRLLRSYNPGSPYVELNRWDPNWTDEDRHERCFDNAHPFLDCVGCEDDYCPWWDSRHDRCWDSLLESLEVVTNDEEDLLESCVSCGLCGHHEEAADRLAELRSEDEQPNDNYAADAAEEVSP
jgi:hypothetical protein